MGKGTDLNRQSRELTEARKEIPELSDRLRAIQQDALERLDLAFDAFFRRLRNGETPGFPRFKSKERYDTFSQKYEAVRPFPIKGDTLTVPGVGTCRIRLSRDLSEMGRCRQLRITRRADGWYALLVCEVTSPSTPLPDTGRQAGIDVGLEAFATLSTGKRIENPRHLSKAAKKLAKEQRRLARKKRGSNNRREARRKVALRHLKVSRSRKDFHHKTAAKLVKRFDLIAVEDLNIKGLAKSRLAKSVLDVAWAAFFRILMVKAADAGRRVEKVDPRFTSQDCSYCGSRRKKALSEREHVCLDCGLVLHRDHNAAINILSRAGWSRKTRAHKKAQPELTPAESHPVRRSRNGTAG
jgi:putative transposase